MRLLRDLFVIVHHMSTICGSWYYGCLRTVSLLSGYEKANHVDLRVHTIIERGMSPTNSVVFRYGKKNDVILYHTDLNINDYPFASFGDIIDFYSSDLLFSFDVYPPTTYYRTSIRNMADIIRLMRIHADLEML